MSRIRKYRVGLVRVLCLAAAIALASSLGVGPLAASDPASSPKPATQITADYNASFMDENYQADLAKEQENAARGLIDAGDGLIYSTVDPDRLLDDFDTTFAFLDTDETPDSVNPSLWEQARLNANRGLFKVTEGVYQVRGYDLANLTFVETDNGWWIMDTGSSSAGAAAALALVNKNLGERPIVAISISHTHADHYAGIRGLLTDEQLSEGKVRIFAPAGFLENAVKENVYAGTAMSRRATYHLGATISRGVFGNVDSGLGKTFRADTTSLIPPTDEVMKDGSYTVDGLTVEFQLTPNTEAPSEMNSYIPQYKVFFGAENVTGTMHNLYTLRGAEVRDALGWSKYIDAAIAKWPKIEYICSSHNWPQFGNADCIDYLEKHRDIYRYIHDATLRLLNQGYTIDEVGSMVTLPPALQREWTIHGYYGSVSHNARAVAQKYIGFFDGNPVHLNPIPPEDSAKKYVEYMGGADAVLARAEKDYENGEYAWVAEVANKVVFAEPDNERAKNLCADALEQMGYQAESAIWRNFYLVGAHELREGVPAIKLNTASPDTLSAMTLSMILDYLAIRFDGNAGQDIDFTMNVYLTDTEDCAIVTVKNSVLNYRLDTQSMMTDVRFRGTKAVLNQMLGSKDIRTDGASVGGDSAKLVEFFTYVEDFTPDFNIVTP